MSESIRDRLSHWLGRLVFAVLAAAALVAGLALSALFFAVVLALLLVAGGWLWWQRRKILRRARQAGAEVIEAEYQVLEVRREPPAAGQPPETPARRRPLD